MGSIAFAMNRSIDERPLGSLELLSIAHTMHDLQFSCHTNRNNRAGRWRCVHSKAVCSICAIGPMFTGAEPPPYIYQEIQTLYVHITHGLICHLLYLMHAVMEK